MKKQIIQSAVFGLACALGVFALLSMFPPTKVVEIRYPEIVEKVVHTTICEQPSRAATVSLPKRKKKKPTQTQQRYIDRFSETAMIEMEKFGIPASISLAQGLLESQAGQSNLAKQNNNHFGIKCFARKCPKDHCTNHHDDHHKDFFRKYKSAWESWRAHSQFLQRKRYAHLQQHGKDFRQWAKGLKAAGYATDPQYAEKLIEMIEDFDLERFDYLTAENLKNS